MTAGHVGRGRPRAGRDRVATAPDGRRIADGPDATPGASRSRRRPTRASRGRRAAPAARGRALVARAARGRRRDRRSCIVASPSTSGPALRRSAEREGSKYLERPMHIGRLSARLTPGVFVVDDLVIEGLTPQRPSVPDRQEDHRRAAVVDRLHPQADRRVGRHDRLEHGRRDASRTAATTFPKFTPDANDAQPGRAGSRRRCEACSAPRGQFTYEDHGTPWSTVAPQLDVHAVPQRRRPTTIAARASFSDGTDQDPDYEPFRATCSRGSRSTAARCTSTASI